jgi:phage/plasmid primase-like uncharacterized protein
MAASSKPRILWDEVFTRAENQWPEILRALSPALHEALDRGSKRHVHCPVHTGDNGDAFRLFDDYAKSGGGVCNTCGYKANGIRLLSWVNNWTTEEAGRAVSQWLGLESEGGNVIPIRTVVREHRPVEPEVPNEQARRRMREAWLQAVPLSHPTALPAREYLKRRGLEQARPTTVLRFHPSLEYYDNAQKRVTGRHPAILALVTRPDGSGAGIHRTYLAVDGCKADVPEAKKLMQLVLKKDTRHAAIRLDTPYETLAMAEGIETALAVQIATGLDVWACVNAPLLELVEVPESVRIVLIFADRDKPQQNKQWPRGEEAARKLMDRMTASGRYARVYLPPPAADGSGIDWADVLVEKGKAGFPAIHLPTEEELGKLLPPPQASNA